MPGLGLLSLASGALKRIPRKVWIALAITAGVALIIWRAVAWFNGEIADAEKRGEDRAYAQVEKAAIEIEAKANALNARIVAELRRKNDDEIRASARAADALRLSGPGEAVCPRGPGAASASGGRVAPGGSADAPGLGVPEDDRAAVPWGWLVDRAEQHDAFRTEALSWREWHRRLLESWPAPSSPKE